MMEKIVLFCFIFFLNRHLLDIRFNDHAIKMISQSRIQKETEVISQFCCVFLVSLQGKLSITPKKSITHTIN